MRPADPPAIHTVSPASTSSRPRADHVGAALGRGRVRDAVGAILLLAHLVAGPEPGDDASGRKVVERDELGGQHVVGREADTCDQRAQEGAVLAARPRREPGRQGAEDGKGRERRSLGLAERPDVVVTEHPVDAGLDRLGRDGERLVGRVAERRQHDAGADHQSPPGARPTQRRSAPARSPKAAGTTTASGRRSLPSTRSSNVGARRVDEQAPGLDDPAAEDETLGVDDAGQVGQTEADPPADLLDDAASRRVAGRGRGGDVLAAHALGVAARHAHDLAEPAGQRSFAGPHAQPGARSEALPAAAAAARARWAVGVDDHVPDLAGEARGADLDPVVHDDAAADARAERDHHDVMEAAGGAEAMFGQHGEVGVVLDDDRSPGEAVADQGGPVDAVRLRQVGRETQPALAVDHAGRTDADGRPSPRRIPGCGRVRR